MQIIGRHVHLQRLVTLACKTRHPRKPFSIMEIGTGYGHHAAAMIGRAFDSGRRHVLYTGYDLFENVSQEVALKEAISVRPSCEQETRGFILRKTQRKGFKLSVLLVSGNSLLSLYSNKSFADHALFQHDPAPHYSNIVFINGGTLATTIASDFRGILHAVGTDTIIIVDNLYAGDYTRGAGLLLDLLSHESIASFWKVRILAPQESFPVRNDVDGLVSGVLKVNMVEIRPTTKDSDELHQRLLKTDLLITERVRKPRMRSTEITPAAVFSLPDGLASRVSPVVSLEAPVVSPAVIERETLEQMIVAFNKTRIVEIVAPISDTTVSKPVTPVVDTPVVETPVPAALVNNELGMSAHLPLPNEEPEHALENGGDHTNIHGTGLCSDRRGDSTEEHTESSGHSH